jgi:SH3-like domain-containing protein
MLLAACSSSPPHAPAKGEAYVGPPTLNLRADIPLQSATVATVKHGDRLDILQEHRSWARVRAPNGAEGWIEQRQLLGTDDMAALKALAKRAASMPAQGQATTDADLRVHIQPAQNAPSFLMLRENDKVDVLTHLRRPRTNLPREPLVPPPPKKIKATRSTRKGDRIPLPPMPAAPPPPANWIDLSKTVTDEDEPAPETEAPAPPVRTEDWSLVRSPDGETGWVVTSRLRMAIPDEVGQYAEGHTIVSYFSLGKLPDGDQQKDTWLWTTLGGGVHPYDFDSIRVFVWSAHRHRYETAHVERNLVGYSPVELLRVPYASGRGKSAETGEYPGFSVCVQDKDGQLRRREYAVLSNLVRYAGEGPCVLPPPVDFAHPGAAPLPSPPAAQAQRPSLLQRLTNRLKSLRGRK